MTPVRGLKAVVIQLRAPSALGHTCTDWPARGIVLWVDGARPSDRIDAGHDVLQAQILREHEPTIAAIKRIDDAELAGGDQQVTGLTLRREIHEHSLEGLVQIPQVAR